MLPLACEARLGGGCYAPVWALLVFENSSKWIEQIVMLAAWAVL